MTKLPAGYEIREMSGEEFTPLWDLHAPKIFDENSPIFRLLSSLTESESAKFKELRANMGQPYQLRLGVFHDGKFAGWCAGHQESAETYYMRNSAILPEHRQRGLYRALMNETVRVLTEKGFQRIYSRHTSTNNAVIIPKLKAGFIITAMEVTDLFGVLVHLTYYPKELRRRVMDYRVGETKPDDEIKEKLGLGR